MSMMGPLPEPEIIVKKVKAKGHAAHHGGAWKVAYADFVTAMMAFFLLMWLLGATDEKQRKGIADYFAPSLLESNSSGGSNGVMGGRSLETPDGAAPHAQRSGVQPATPYQASTRGPKQAGGEQPGREQSARELEKEIRQKLREAPALKDMDGHLKITETPEGVRIELVDQADHSMFASGNTTLDPRAAELLAVVAAVIADVPNRIAIRGHTDATPFASNRPDDAANNWSLSAARAEATRQGLLRAGVAEARFSRLEGVAATDPQFPENPTDPRNRRMSITLLRE